MDAPESAPEGPQTPAVAERHVEPLLRERQDWQVWTAFEVDQELMQMYSKAVASFWTVQELDFGQDQQQYEALKDGEKHFISHVLAFFAASDGLVGENLVGSFFAEVQDPSARLFYSFQIAMEAVHSECYALLLKTYEPDVKKQRALFSSIQHFPAIKRKSEWAAKWCDTSIPFAERLVAWAVVEGLLFSGSFCAVFWLSRVRGILPGLGASNEFISRDEGLHCLFACMLHDRLEKPASKSRIISIVHEAVVAEREFCCEALPVDLIGMNSQLMGQYIEYVADYLLIRLGCPPQYKKANPFPWMELVSLGGKSNFFEKRATDYQRFGVMDGHEAFTFDTDAEF